MHSWRSWPKRAHLFLRTVPVLVRQVSFKGELDAKTNLFLFESSGLVG